MSIRRRIKVETKDRKDVLAEAIFTQDEFLEKFFANPLSFQFFFGAGMSASAGVPLSKDIVESIIIKIFEKSNPARRGQVTAEDLREWVSREKWFNPNYPYISALEKEYPSMVLRTELFKSYMRGRFPSPAQLHYAIGVKENKLANRCYTTNWDTLTEDAFYWLRGTNCTTIKGPDQLQEVKDYEHRYVIKLHGDLDRYDVRYLREGMAKHNDDLRDFLVKSLSNVGLVMLGYSGLEYSVMNMLMEIVHDNHEVLNGGLYWGYIGNIKQIPESITDLLAIGLDKGKDFRLFECDEADFLMDNIARKLEFTPIEEELSSAFFRFNKMGYGKLRDRIGSVNPNLNDLAHRDLLDEGFLVRDYNAIHEVWKQETKGMFKKKEEKDRASRDAERKLVNHCYNDLKHENFADAEVKFKDVLTHFPENDAAHWGLGWVKFATGRYEEALADFDKSIAMNPKQHGTYIAKALCYNSMGKHTEEIQMYDKVLAMKGDLDYIWYNRGVAASKTAGGQVELESYKAATAANPGNYRAWHNLGICYSQNGEHTQAVRCFNKAAELSSRLFESVYNSGILLGRVGQDMQAIERFDRCIEINQDDDEAFKSRGIAEVMIGHYDNAGESYAEYLSAKPDDPEAWFNNSVALYHNEKLDDALDYLQRYMDQFPNDARAWYNKGLIHYAENNKDKAMECFNKSLSINDDYDMVWYRKALLLGEMEEYTGEIELLTKFLTSNDQDLRGWFELGQANFKLGDAAEDSKDSAGMQKYYSAAVKAYDRALDVQRTDVRVWLQKATCLNKLRRYEEARECIKYLERYDKENAEVYYQKGLALDGLGDQLAAADTLNESIKRDPDHEGAYYLRGLLLAELEQYAKAVDHFNNVLRINDKSWQAFHFKGICINKQKEYDRALTVFEEGMSRFPDKARFLVDQAMSYVMMRDIDTAGDKLRDAIQKDPSLRDEITNTPEFHGLL